MTWTFTIPEQLPSRNTTKRAHWASLKRFGDACAWSLIERKRALGIPDATGKRRVVITRLIGKGGKAYDVRNIDDKRMTDEMVRVGLLVDDAPKWIDIEVNQERAEDGVPGTRVTIEDLEEP